MTALPSPSPTLPGSGRMATLHERRPSTDSSSPAAPPDPARRDGVAYPHRAHRRVPHRVVSRVVDPGQRLGPPPPAAARLRGGGHPPGLDGHRPAAPPGFPLHSRRAPPGAPRPPADAALEARLREHPGRLLRGRTPLHRPPRPALRQEP